MKNLKPLLKKSKSTNQILLIMKIFTFLLLVCIIPVTAGKVYSQDKKVTLSGTGISLEKLFQRIEDVSDYRFLYRTSGYVDLNKKVNLNARNEKLSSILSTVLSNTGINYTLIGNNLIVISPAFEQQKLKVSGRVTDSNGQPLVGVTIFVKGTNRGTTTDKDGNYSLTITTSDKELVFTFIGMKKQEVLIEGRSDVNIVMEAETNKLDEVVVIGYGTQHKTSLTAAVSSIKSDEIALIPTSNLSNVLAGRLSGTFVQSGTGVPGISSSIRVRAQSSWNGGEPIYVIDGVARDKTSFDALDPNEVAEITILKDAASAAIYGSRSSNGVILVTTKTGKTGKPVIQYSTIFSFNKVGKMPKYMSVSDGLDLWNNVNGGISADEKAWILKTNPDGMNFYNAAYKDPNNQKHSLSVSGGNDIITYYMGGSFYDENGFLPNVWYKKYNLRGNLQVKLTKDLTVGLNLSNSNGTRNRYNFTYDGGSSDLNNLWYKLQMWSTATPPYIDGKPVNPGWLGNSIEMMKNGGSWRNNNQQVDALLNAEYKISQIPGLSVKASYSRNYDNSFIKSFAKKQLLYNFQTTGANNLIYTDKVLSTQLSGDPGTEYLGNEYTKTDAYQLNGQINYDHHFGNHYINALVAYEQYEYQYNYFSMYRYNFPLFPTDQFFATSGNSSDWSTSGNESQDGRLSYIGRVNYEYAGKYLFSSSIRRDGSIKFAPSKRWGWFPSASVGWVISKEDFFKKSEVLNFVDMLKLRFSYGSTGNDAIGGWQWQDQYNIQGSTYYLGNPGTTVPRLAYGGIPNPDITWEKSNSYNAGIDLMFLKNFTFTTEFWWRHTYDILGSRILALPTEFGGTLPAVNYGKVDSRGLEIELGYNNKIGKDFSYSLKGNFGLATTKVVQKDVAANAQDVDNPNGKTLSYATGLVATGILRTQADLDKLPAGYTYYGANYELGMMAFKDISGINGKPDGKIDDYDRVVLGKYIGSANAPISYGMSINLNYKRFRVDMLFAGLSGFKIIYNDSGNRNFGTGGLAPMVTYYFNDSWTEQNPNGSTPKVYSWGDSRATYVRSSTYNTYDGSFVRLKNLEIKYDIPSIITKKIGISAIQIFASGTNLFTLTKFKFYDPEIYGLISYPLMKTYSIGFNVQF